MTEVGVSDAEALHRRAYARYGTTGPIPNAIIDPNKTLAGPRGRPGLISPATTGRFPMRTRFILMACAAAATAIAGPAASQSVSQSAAFKGDLASFHGGKRTLIKAIRDLQADGSRVVDIRFSPQNGAPAYHVVLQKNGRYTLMRFDEHNGRVTSVDWATAPDWMAKWNSRVDLRLDRKAKVGLVRAIRTAEAANGGAPAVAAGIARSASNPTSEVHAYNVILDRGGQAKRVAVDSATGEIIANPSALNSLE